MTVVLKTLVNFDYYSTGGYPYFSNLLLDANGNLFGTTYEGGPDTYGTVFEIAHTASGYASSPTILFNPHTLAGNYGYYLEGGLVADANGNLFGTTVAGNYGYGHCSRSPRPRRVMARFRADQLDYYNGYYRWQPDD